MSLSVEGGRRGQIVVGDGMVQRRMQGRRVALLPKQVASVDGGWRRREMQQGWRRASAVAVRHAAPLALLHRAGGAPGAHSAHAGVGPLVRIARTHYHTVVLLGGHGAGHTIRARTHFTLHFTFTYTHWALRLAHFLRLYALVLFTGLGDITTRTHTILSTCNKTTQELMQCVTTISMNYN